MKICHYRYRNILGVIRQTNGVPFFDDMIINWAGIDTRKM